MHDTHDQQDQQCMTTFAAYANRKEMKIMKMKEAQKARFCRQSRQQVRDSRRLMSIILLVLGLRVRYKFDVGRHPHVDLGCWSCKKLQQSSKASQAFNPKLHQCSSVAFKANCDRSLGARILSCRCTQSGSCSDVRLYLGSHSTSEFKSL